ncbi:MAG: deoxyuridine 5'-triphosphate nucleotidohydrolase [Halobacteria archaeon]
MVIRNGGFVAEYVEDVNEDAVQPNGVDLSVGKIYRHEGRSVVKEGEYELPDRVELDDKEGFYELEPGGYTVEYGEVIEIPEDHAGFIYPRSRLMRCGGMLFSAVWDSGYRGRGEGGLWVQTPMKLEKGMKIGQMVYTETENLDETYDGSHQGENL